MAARAASSGVNPLGSAETFATISGGAASRFRPAVALAFQKFQGLSTTSVHHRQILFRVIFTLSPNAVVSRRQFDRLMLLMDHPCRRAKNTQEQLLTGLIQLSSGVCLDAMCVASNLTLSERPSPHAVLHLGAHFRSVRSERLHVGRSSFAASVKGPPQISQRGGTAIGSRSWHSAIVGGSSVSTKCSITFSGTGFARRRFWARTVASGGSRYTISTRAA